MLTRNGYEAFSFVSIPQLRPYRYDNFTAMGFQRSRVFDAIRMREGKRNVYFNAMNDGELLGYAAALADSVAKATTKPMFVHVRPMRCTFRAVIPIVAAATTISRSHFRWTT